MGVGAQDTSLDTTFHIGGWGATVTLLLKSFAEADKSIKESVMPKNLQSVSDWLMCWNSHGNSIT